MLGNFPQAYSHVGLNCCALNLTRETASCGGVRGAAAPYDATSWGDARTDTDGPAGSPVERRGTCDSGSLVKSARFTSPPALVDTGLWLLAAILSQ